MKKAPNTVSEASRLGGQVPRATINGYLGCKRDTPISGREDEFGLDMQCRGYPWDIRGTSKMGPRWNPAVCIGEMARGHLVAR